MGSCIRELQDAKRKGLLKEEVFGFVCVVYSLLVSVLPYYASLGRVRGLNQSLHDTIARQV